METPNELREVMNKLEKEVAGYLKKASSDEGEYIPLDLAELFIEKDLVRVTRDFSTMSSAASGNDISYGLTDSGRKLYNELVANDYYETESP